jgi:hypothetical protein
LAEVVGKGSAHPTEVSICLGPCLVETELSHIGSCNLGLASRLGT